MIRTHLARFSAVFTLCASALAPAPAFAQAGDTTAGSDAAATSSGSGDTAGTTPATPDAGATPDSAETSAGAEATGKLKLGAEAEADVDADASGKGPSRESPVEMAPGANRCGAGPLHQGDHPTYVDRRCYDPVLGNENIILYGGLELDVGYARYTYDPDDSPQNPYDELYDLRGRFVFGPMLRHDFSDDLFVSATVQLVGWVRERFKTYQINVDDAYGQVGGSLGGAGNWDFQVGRFMTWRVYHKGLGWDLYTLEHNGASLTRGVSTGSATYATRTYEVNYIYLRNADSPINDETAGRAALHYYPTPWLGFELTGVYGQSDAEAHNVIGGRLAIDFHHKLGPALVRLSAAAEDRYERPSAKNLKQTGANPAGEPIYEECPDCEVKDNKGFGGGGIVKVSILEVGGGAAMGWDITHENPASSTNAPRSPAGTGERISYGGYVQLDPGSLLFKRPLIVGAGLQYAELALENRSFQEHIQGAAYIALPLGFNDAMVKLVLSRAEAELLVPTSPVGAPLVFRTTENAMTAGRVRFTYPF